MTDYYETLGIPRNANDAEIRRAYLKLSLKWHPDKNPGNPEAEEKFKGISSAYAVLSDPSKKRQYDLFGSSSTSNAPNFEGFSGEEFAQFTEFAENLDPMDVFEKFMDKMESETGTRDPVEMWDRMSADPETRGKATVAAGIGAGALGVSMIADAAQSGSFRSLASGVGSILGGLWVASGYAPDMVTNYCGETVAKRAQEVYNSTSSRESTNSRERQ